ncbi:DNA modification methylase [Bacteroidetes oral taxon 274 str. F0058]|nr:DNA modification methylase [Bacteroidetes oral taxon 274 str. F0058]
MRELLTIKEARDYATEYVGKNVTPSNISYLVQYGKVRKFETNGVTKIDKYELLSYYNSIAKHRAAEWKEKLGDDLNWSLSFDKYKEAEILENKQGIISDVLLFRDDCLNKLKQFKDDSIDLIITSPPYADQRKKTYGGIPPNKYVEWFLSISEQLLRVLKPSGTFILNIKEKVSQGERSTYVIELVLEMKKQGWLWTEEFIWHKKNSFPGKWSNRFRDSWERLLQFNKNKKFNMYQDAVKIPIGDWASDRLKKLSDVDKIRDNAKNGSGFGKKVSNWLGKDMVYPSNVLYLATECNNKKHSAAFPESLPEWFIKLFTQEGDIVLDPFVGSGTTLSVAYRLNRKSIGIEIIPQYIEVIKNNFKGN